MKNESERSAEEILTDKVGKLALSGLKWKSLHDRKQRIIEAMEEYASQFKAFGEWISVDRELPEESGRYWCYVVHFSELGKSCEQVNCSWSERHGFTEKLNPMNVTHWMPLPSPPRKPE